ncbi:protein-tyrosine phosphatase-like protein [Radiomyces spectabilis]|uniref:protein-tyrosine phosphatase-like protein n=1 Tax=Radiomyces spectabilis TaxID=64574 RepID=UPI00221F98C7|nr:protein-tyrosine phosphatase-like protein [Radiomyces spectabilis]KAI8372874.1 protein-tyrosine phosphatase-like protein [Radiomyces spectabilis]
MSVAYDSPTHRRQTNENYFTPLNMPPMLGEDQQPNTASTPYYTAPINPALHQDFLNAIQHRHASQPTVLTPVGEKKNNMSPTPPPVLSMAAVGSSLAARRKQAVPGQPSAMETQRLNELMTSHGDRILILDVRSFVQYTHARIRTAINVAVPNTILKRPTFTLEKVYEAIVLDNDRDRLKRWKEYDHIIIYDQGSQFLPDNCAANFLCAKFSQAGYQGSLKFLKGGFDAFMGAFPTQCESSPPVSNRADAGRSLPPAFSIHPHREAQNPLEGRRRPQLQLSNLPPPTSSLGPFTAPMPQFDNQAFNPFFSNIRQNMELSHGPIRERFPINLPENCNADPQTGYVKPEKTEPRCVAGAHIEKDNVYVAPTWLRNTIEFSSGPQLLAEMYEKLERTEQRRLQNIMLFHSKHTNTNPPDFPLSIVAGIEMGTLNRYTNIWPFEYTRVKIAQPHGPTDYINASYIQYVPNNSAATDAPDHVSKASLQIMKTDGLDQPYRRYISTQGPLPATFNDFWQVIWEQNSRVLVMLTKEEEMNKIKCHRYWPSTPNQPTQYGKLSVTLLSETIRSVKRNGEQQNADDVVIVRQLVLAHEGANTRRMVTQLHYTGWMDFGVPENPLGTLQVIEAANDAQQLYESQEPNIGPMVVHCSAGCGRSGAFCVIDTVLRRISQSSHDLDDHKDVLLETIALFREQRLSMVQTMRQFVFCYEAIWWWILGYGQLNYTDKLPVRSHR